MSLNEKKKKSEIKEAELVDDKSYQSPYAGSAEELLKEMQQEISPEATPLWQYINRRRCHCACRAYRRVYVLQRVS